jgi:thymidylate kinase
MDGSTAELKVLSQSEHQISRPFAALLASFHKTNIIYCYWRSSRRIEAALAGDSDLDLLVAKEDQYRAWGNLLQTGFKYFPAVAHRNHPAISSFLSYDEQSGRIVHVHLHVRLVIGGALLKTHRVQWEDVILERAVWHSTLPIRVLDPTDEALLMHVRSCLELRRTDPVALYGWSTLKQKFVMDRDAVAARLDRATLLHRARRMLCDELADHLTDALLRMFTRAADRRLRRRIRKELRVWRTSGAIEEHARTAMLTVLWLAGKLNARFLHRPRPWRRRAPGGGCVVALIGVDGSGKTTVMNAIRAWLEPEVDVMPIYFGTGGGRPSLLLLPLKLMLPLVMACLRTKPKGSSHGRVSDRAPGRVYSLLMMVWATVLSAEKRIKLLAARRGAERGLIILADRYPQDENPTYNDGPLLSRLTWAPRWLRAVEARAYALARRLPPDLVIRLDVSVETAVRREPNMDQTVIRNRIAALRRLTFPGARLVCVDADRPLAEVLRAVKHEIWQLL